MDATQIFQRSENARTMLRQMLSDAHAITGCSAQTVRDAEEFFGEAFGARARTIYSGIRLADFPPKTSARLHVKPYILGIGRHVEQKGFDILIRAYNEFKKQVSQDENAGEIPDLIIAGDGPMRAQLETLTQQLNLQDQITFVGRTSRAQTINWFQNCEFFVLPSRKEPMGIVNLEAMAASKAVVASDVGGVPELVQNGVTGILVAPENVSALARALEELWKNPTKRTEMGVQGAERVKKFDWDALAAQYLASYSAALDLKREK